MGFRNKLRVASPVAIAMLLVTGVMSPVQALDEPQDPYVEIVGEVTSDGTCGDGSQPDFDPTTGDNRGFDNANDNGIVCWGDTIRTNVSIAVQDADVDDLIVYYESNIPFNNWGSECDILPEQDPRPGTEWANEERTAYFCNLGPVAEGTKIADSLNQRNNLPNGEVITTTGCIVTPNANTGGFDTYECVGPFELVSTEADPTGIPFYAALDKSKTNLSATRAGESEDDQVHYPPSYTADNGAGVEGKYISWDLDFFIDKENTRLLDDGTGGVTLTIEDTWTVTDQAASVVADNIELVPDRPIGFGINTFSSPYFDGCYKDPTVATFTQAAGWFTVACTQPGGPGTPIIIELEIPDVDRVDEAVEGSFWSGTAVHNSDPDYYYFDISYTVFIPMSDIDVTPSGDSVQIDNTATIVSSTSGPLPLRSQQGEINTGPETDTSSIIVNDQRPGTGGVEIQKTFLGTDRSGFQEKTGSRVAYPGELVHSKIEIHDSRNFDTNPAACDTIDTSVFTFEEPANYIQDKHFTSLSNPSFWRTWHGSSSLSAADPYLVSVNGVQYNLDYSTDDLLGTQIAIEYTDVANLPSHWDATCDDDDNGDGTYDWVNDPNLLAGGPSSVTKVRITWNRDFAEIESGAEGQVSGSALEFYIPLRVRSDAGLTDGDLLPNTMTYKLGPDADSSDERWINPVNDSGADVQDGAHFVNQDPMQPLFSFDYWTADRIEINTTVGSNDPIQIRANKDIDEWAYFNSYDDGDILNFELGISNTTFNVGVNGNPILSESWNEPHTWTFVDELPEWLNYQGNNCVDVFPTCVVDDTDPTRIVFTIPDQSWADIYGTTGNISGLENKLTLSAAFVGDWDDYVGTWGETTTPNTLQVSVDDVDVMAQYPDGFVEDSWYGYIYDNERLKVSKEAVESSVDMLPGDTSAGVAWDVTVENDSWNYLEGQQFIDIFPYVGDGIEGGETERFPETDGSATLELNGITSAEDSGFAVEYTTADPASIFGDPCHYSNWPAGATVPASGTCQIGFVGDDGLLDSALTGSGDTTWSATAPADMSTVTAVRVNLSDLNGFHDVTYRLEFTVSDVAGEVL